ncbi:MAG: ARMT1-like domain-containing protein [Clostridia bacterium]|nr:ARMT1-like domain-containing protein [Clostridia bacterium]
MKKILPPECIDCVIEKKFSDYPKDADTEKIIEYKRKVLEIILNADEEGAAPLIGREIANVKESLFGIKQDYSEIKQTFNSAMLKIENEIRNKVFSSNDVFISAMKFAIAGNYIDVSAVKDLNEKTLIELLEKSSDFNLSDVETENLKNDLIKAKNIVYVTDNCGEIVLDKIFIEVIKSLNKNAKITAIVRGKQVANDATEKDALSVGLNSVCKVVGNGSDIPGTYLKEISPAAKDAILSADVIISKGQGNYETLSYCGLNVYYLFLCKCDMFLKRFDVPLFTPLIVNEKRKFN